ncbi:hypothetical protein Goarm_023413, partial [Gossypium armourianum]|nr:hypothetical protein [Gossypium armourianum]
MWPARGLLVSGICWRIGSGANIFMIEDAWLPSSQSYLIHENINLRGVNVVADYIDNDSMIWKEELTRSTFPDEIPKKVKILMWKATWNFLPTMVNLQLSSLKNSARYSSVEYGGSGKIRTEQSIKESVVR